MSNNGRPVTVPIERLAHGRELPLPAYATSGSAGLDLMAAIATAIDLAPGARDLVPAGITLSLPAGYEAQIRPRSGLALMHGITVLNSPGTIDSDYRGEIKVLLVNHGQDAFRVEPGMRIAQLVVAPVMRIAWAEDAAQPASERGAGGYGSTGVAAR
ncbi:MAG: dUTP diphosphatase [Rhodospirillaceae bacterium]|nr:dUTP diphosphatase [Rhodospirillaceae bacterium]